MIISDMYGNQYNYLSYYQEYCTNLGDLILGMSRCAYSQVSNYTPDELNALLNSDDAKLAVSKSFNTDGILKVAALSADDFKLLIGSADGLNIDVLVSLYTSDQGLTPKVKKISFKTSKLVI